MRVYKFLTAFCVFWFILLCLLHYFSSRALWLDENFILENIKSLNFQGLLGPLKNSQAFPRAYLMMVKYISQKFNYNIFSLRFFPLISMLLAFFVWARIYSKEFSHKWHFLLALFSFASSYRLVYYAAELKQFSLDVLVMGIFCLYLVYQKKTMEKRLTGDFVILTLFLPLTIALSYAGLFIFWIVIYNFLFSTKKDSRILFLSISYFFICSLVIALVYYFDLRYTLSMNAMSSYWNDYFLCTDSPYCFIKSFGEGLRRLATWWFGNSKSFMRLGSFFIPFFVLSLFGFGLSSLKKDKFRLWGLDAVGLVIFLELFILGIIKKYPFTGERITLFFAPFVFYFIIKGTGFFKARKPLYVGLSIFYVSFILLCGLNTFSIFLKLYLSNLN